MTKESSVLYFYEEALMPKKFRVCSIELRPFCLGHLCLLERIGSPLMSVDETPIAFAEGLFDFFVALAICSLTYENGLKLLEDDEYAKTVLDAIQEAVYKNMEIEGEDWNMYYKTNSFKQYMEYFINSMPIYSIEQKKPSQPTGLDWKIGLQQVFKKLDYSESEIFNMNMRRLFYEWCSFMETEGGIKVLNGINQQPVTITVGEPDGTSMT